MELSGSPNCRNHQGDIARSDIHDHKGNNESCVHTQENCWAAVGCFCNARPMLQPNVRANLKP